MPAKPLDFTQLALPRVGAAVSVAALVFPGLTLPLIVVCLVGLGKLALEESRGSGGGAGDPAQKLGQEGAVRPAEDATSTDDSFPASDPPSWTPVSGVGTRH